MPIQNSNLKMQYKQEQRTSYVPRSFTPGPAAYRTQTQNLNHSYKMGRGFGIDEDSKEKTFRETQKLIQQQTPGPLDYQSFATVSHVDGPQIKIKQKYTEKRAISPGPGSYSPKRVVKSERDIRIGIKLQEIRNQKNTPGPAAYFGGFLDRTKASSPGFKMSANGGQIDRNLRKIIPIQMSVK